MFCKMVTKRRGEIISLAFVSTKNFFCTLQNLFKVTRKIGGKVSFPSCGVGMFIHLLDYTELLTHLGEGGDSLVEVLAAVSGRELYADTSLILRYGRSGWEIASSIGAKHSKRKSSTRSV